MRRAATRAVGSSALKAKELVEASGVQAFVDDVGVGFYSRVTPEPFVVGVSDGRVKPRREGAVLARGDFLVSA